ncbi:MAG TPA: hypothetical protein VFH90_05445 [Candidatus Limnocylindria bacterium]|nr:hypothetical protein [Candidatus Limnocylindria bacterium]
MVIQRCVVALAALALAACTDFVGGPTPTVTPSQAPFGGMELISEGPVLRASDLGDYGAVLPSAYFMADGVQHAYLVGFGDARGDQRVFHATSPDGLAWTVDEADPFANLGLDLSPPGPVSGSVLQADDGTWLMYLWGVPSPGQFGAVIYRATADSPAGPWVADPEPVLGLGERGAWDDLGVDFPAVGRTDDGFVMIYGASNSADRETSSIGVATSPDGVTWTKDPANPVISADHCGDPDARYAAGARLLQPENNPMLLLFDVGREIRIGISSDAREWTCASADPILTADDVPGSEGIHTIAATLVEGEALVLVESLVEGGSELWLARAWQAEA